MYVINVDAEKTILHFKNEFTEKIAILSNDNIMRIFNCKKYDLFLIHKLFFKFRKKAGKYY